MQSLPYSSLTQTQRARVAYLFADQAFGTDPAAYLYQVTGDEVQRRKPIQMQAPVTRRARDLAPAKVTMMQEVNITNELIHTATINMDALAATIANNIHQSKRQEVSA